MKTSSIEVKKCTVINKTAVAASLTLHKIRNRLQAIALYCIIVKNYFLCVF